MWKTGLILGGVMLSALIWAVGGGVGRPPACSDVWVAGTSLSGDYSGCNLGGALVAPTSRECADGSVLVVFDNYWAFRGGIIRTSGIPGGSTQSPAFASDLARCGPGR
jgi:hypothetical protein